MTDAEHLALINRPDIKSLLDRTNEIFRQTHLAIIANPMVVIDWTEFDAIQEELYNKGVNTMPVLRQTKLE